MSWSRRNVRGEFSLPAMQLELARISKIAK